MQAIVVHELGGPEVLALRDHPAPRPGPGEALVALRAIGVNFSDTERRRGVYDPPALPWIPGNEAAGVVEELGPGVEPAWLGKRVAFWAPRTSGTYAQFTAAPVAAFFALQDDIDFSIGASLPVQGLTAYALSHAATALEPGTSALVHAAAGGVGTLLIQLLKRRGVRVFGTASTAAKRDLVRSHGAEPLPYGPALSGSILDATGGRGVDAVFDSVGESTRAESFAVLARYGQLTYFGDASGAPAPIQVDELYGRCLRVSAFWLAADPPERWNEARRELQAWVAEGSLKVNVGQAIPLQHAAEAHRRLESRETQGKLILIPAV